MNPKLGLAIFIFCNIAACFVVGYAVNEFFYVKNALANGDMQIPFDTGIYYFLLASIFWVLAVIIIIGKRNPQAKLVKYANPLIISWFIAMLVLANVIPRYQEAEFDNAGYTRCHDPAEISNISRGESVIYMKGSCKDLTAH